MGLYFNNSPYVPYGAVISAAAATAFTFTFWLKIDAIANDGIVTISTDLANNLGKMHVAVSGTSMFYRINTVDFDQNFAGVDTNWHFYCVWYDGTDGKLWQDITLKISAAYSTAIDFSGTSLYAGVYFAVANVMDGKMAELRFYNRAISDKERLLIYKHPGNDKIVSGSLLNSRMIEKSTGQTASGAGSIVDTSPQANHGTAVNTPAYINRPIRIF